MRKKLFFALMLMVSLLLVSALADEPFNSDAGSDAVPHLCDEPPSEVLAHIAKNWSGWKLEDYALIEDTPQGDYGFALLNKGRTRMLVGYHEQDGKMKYWLKSEPAVPQGDGAGWITHVKKGEKTGDQRKDTTFTSDGLTFSVCYVVPDSEYYYKSASYAWKDGGFKLISFYDYEEYYGTAYVEDGYLDYWNWSVWERDANVEGTVQTELRYVDFAALPKSPKQARQELSLPPTLPAGELTAQKVKFEGGGKFDVYTGPGTEYARSGNGKGSVSTNDWIQVFGEQNGWILIQYDISADHFRIGWIDAKALPAGVQVGTLAFSGQTATVTSACSLTDDPLQSRAQIASVAQGTTVSLLSTLGDWQYVRVETGVKPICGFIPLSHLSKN